MLSRLQLEHDNILKSLNLLELQYLDMCRGRTPDYSLMRSIIVYIQEYPEQIHHPMEDMVFSILLERLDDAEDNVEFVQRIITEHTQLEDVTRRLRESLESMLKGMVPEETLKQQLSEFLAGMRQHIIMEETELYPLIQKVLTNKDWNKLQSMLPILDDPIFGRRTRDDYERLYREIEDKNIVLMQSRNDNLNPTDTDRLQLAAG
jgi:hemerythrin-like domain-containing protein